MSSILDALNKAEEERNAAEDALARGFDDLDIEDELTGRTSANGARKLRSPWTPLNALALSVAFVAVVAAVSGGAAVVTLHLRNEASLFDGSARSAYQEQPMAAVAPIQPVAETQTIVRPALASGAAESVETDARRATASPTPAAGDPVPPPSNGPTPTEVAAILTSPAENAAGATPVEPAPGAEIVPPPPVAAETAAVVTPTRAPGPAPAEPAPPWEPEVVAPDTPAAPAAPPEPVMAASTDTLPEPAPAYPDTAEAAEPVAAPVSRKTPAISQDAPSGEVDIMTLPELTDSERRRLQLPEITVNVVGRPSKYRPQPSAMINFSRVVLNEFIPGTNARLIGVSLHGIGIQVGQERYFVPK
ncbi:MAG TPA: hypothetical protein PK166_05260 [Candidatus Hydrogenedentes bacterium]|nr:hypothetical protein [Candidatus Hydrogenedentota bacterium]